MRKTMGQKEENGNGSVSLYFRIYKSSIHDSSSYPASISLTSDHVSVKDIQPMGSLRYLHSITIYTLLLSFYWKKLKLY